ncbi:hypothetical protein [Streptomyces sp. NBC_00582]|uniref:hypothetical protein n=1 Tax=Streptomyces sp. NBC_00582 TaxID=2975783 RepID=UPI0010D77200|nr:hypothetical protein [Streptomyces sp. NBC_00582]WUB67383.1 hypothetical protein OG852_46815 [Streptomyces sp. NBC_00582]
MASSGTKTLLTVLPALAKALNSHPVPIDYDRRRRLFSPDSVDFDHHAYQTLCRRHGWRPHAPLRIKRLRWHLARLLLGADPGAASRTPAGHLAFRYRLHPGLHELLHQQAAANLEAHGIDEPVSFEPPPAWITDPGLPPGPETINQTLGPTAPHPVQQRPPTPGRRTPRQGVLAPQSLKRLYQEQQLLQHEIAELAGCSISTVRHALDEAGIPLRRRRPAGHLKKTISRTWLEKEYHHKGRSSPDIARELGVRKDDVMRLVKTWGHPPTPHQSVHQPLRITRHRSVPRDARRQPDEELHTATTAPHGDLQTRHSSRRRCRTRGGLGNSQLPTEASRGDGGLHHHRHRPVPAPHHHQDGRRFLDEATRLLSLLDDHSP